MDNTNSTQSHIRILHRKDAVQAYMHPDVQNKAPHFHYQCELILNVGGSADFNISGTIYHIKPGSMLLINNMENHFIVSHSEGYDRYTARFSNDVLASYIHDPLLLSIFKQRIPGFSHHYICTQQESAHYALMLGIMVNEYKLQRPYWEQLITSKLKDVLIYMYRNNPEAFPGTRNQDNQNLIYNIQNYIESHLDEDLQLDTLADKFFISKYHLSHCFKNVTGYGFKEYVITARLSKAKDMLLRTSYEVQKISSTVGFNSSSHFIRCFKAAEGISPLQYRNQGKTDSKS